MTQRRTSRPLPKDRANTIEAKKPWLDLGMSRRTWYRRQAEQHRGDSKTTWCVYLVSHPFTKAPVYAGVTTDIAARRNAHTAANAHLRSSLLRKRGTMWGLVPEVVVVGRYRTKEKALDREIKIIHETPGLLNERAIRAAGRPRIEDRANTIEAKKPWLKLGMSRRTWYRRQAEKRRNRAISSG